MPRRAAEHALASAPGEGRLQPRRQPLQARARHRVERILDATVGLLKEHSVEDLTTAAIAERAGVPIGSVYHYFPSKEAILVELAGRKFQAVDGAFALRLGAELERRPWRRALELAVDESVAAFREDPGYVTVWRAMRSSPSFRSIGAASDEHLSRALASLPLLSRIPPARLRLAMRASIRMANSFLDWVLVTQDPRQAAAIVREMKRALIAYLAPDVDAAARAPARPPSRLSRRAK
jgi:AcrR family transcriptional regulator